MQNAQLHPYLPAVSASTHLGGDVGTANLTLILSPTLAGEASNDGVHNALGHKSNLQGPKG